MEVLPDLDSLSDQELRDLIHRLMEDERKVSYERRILHGKIDILRAERTRRTRGEGGLSVEDLAVILSKGTAGPRREAS